MTLRDLFEVYWTITDVHLTVRDADGKFLHRWIFAEGITDRETVHQRRDRMEGKLTLVDEKVNHHGEPTRGGSEMGWGVRERIFAKSMLDAPIRHMGVMSSLIERTSLDVDVEMQPLTCMTLIPKEEEDAGADNDL